MLYRDRKDAGERLAEHLRLYADEAPIVLGLPRGGVVVAAEVARVLHVPLDVWVARKMASPRYPEYGFGAIAPDAIVLDPESVSVLRLTDEDIREVEAAERAEMNRRIALYRGERPSPKIEGETVILVDDGLATGVTARAAAVSLRKRNPKKIVFAAPVCAPDSSIRLLGDVDQVVCAATPERFSAVGLWYDDFRQTEDDEVIALLEQQPAWEADRTIEPSERKETRTDQENRP